MYILSIILLVIIQYRYIMIILNNFFNVLKIKVFSGGEQMLFVGLGIYLKNVSFGFYFKYRGLNI